MTGTPRLTKDEESLVQRSAAQMYGRQRLAREEISHQGRRRREAADGARVDGGGGETGQQWED